MLLSAAGHGNADHSDLVLHNVPGTYSLSSLLSMAAGERSGNKTSDTDSCLLVLNDSPLAVVAQHFPLHPSLALVRHPPACCVHCAPFSFAENTSTSHLVGPNQAPCAAHKLLCNPSPKPQPELATRRRRQLQKQLPSTSRCHQRSTNQRVCYRDKAKQESE